jgi:hypothetical protein
MNCYGPILPQWDEEIRRLLNEIDLVEGFLTEDCLAFASLLAAETKKRMEDVVWIINLSRRLQELEIELKRSGGGLVRKALQQTQVLIWEIRGGN